MKLLNFFVFVLFAVCDAVLVLNRPSMPYPLRVRRLQHEAAMYGMYQPDMMYIPSITTFTSGDSVSTDYHPQPDEKPCLNCNNIPKEPDLEESTQVYKTEVVQPAEEEASVSTATKIPSFEEATTYRTKTKTVPKKPDEDEEEDYDYWPYVKNQGRKVPPYNVFFPMMFGYSGRSGHESGHPGGVTAIANSFSSGKGGIATSHATAVGSPPANKQSNWKRRSQEE